MKNKIVVSKLGSSLIASRKTGLMMEDIHRYVRGIVSNYPDHSHIFVVSGAREVGIYLAEKLFDREDLGLLSDKQLAGLGAITVFKAFETAEVAVGLAGSSFPVTHHLLWGDADKKTLQERQSFMDVLRENAKLGITTNINEADAMNDKELMRQVFASEYEIDNDQIAAHIAVAVKASNLDLWKEHEGLRDDRGNNIHQVNDNNFEEYSKMLRNRSKSLSGRGGPGTTLQAAVTASRAGVETRIVGVNQDMSGTKATRVVVG